MLGMVFTEFVDLVEARFGIEVLDRVIEEAALGHEAAYTAVGYYPFAELQQLLLSLCRETGAEPGVLLQSFGRHLFARLQAGHPQFFSDPGLDLFSLLERLDGVVHVEVRKLYANARLPSFTCTRIDDEHLQLDYVSERGLADLAAGLIDGAALHFGEQVRVARGDTLVGGVQCVRFLLARVLH